MKFLLLLFPILAFAQNIPSDQVKIGRPQTSADKELIFDTNDGVLNKKLSIEKTTKKLKWDGNSVQIGDGAATDKEIIINGTAGKALKYDSASSQFEFNDDLGINGFSLKSNTIVPFSGTETSIEQDARVKGKLSIGTGPNRLRVSGGNLEFTNDGTIFKKIGSGTGGGEGGINLASNPSFEDGTGSWTATGGTYSVLPYSQPSENNLNYARFIASGVGQKLCSNPIIVPDFLTGGCLAYSQYKTTNNNAFELEVLSASNIINRVTLPTTEGKWLQTPPVPVLCPDAGQNIQVCYDSLTAGTIEVDQVYKGSENRIFELSQALLVGESYFASGGGYASTGYTAASGTRSPTLVITNMGSWQTAAQSGYRQTVNNLPPGCYTLEWTFGAAGSNVGAFQQFMAVVNGANLLGSQTGFTNGTSAGSMGSVKGSHCLTTTQNVTYELVGASSVGSVTLISSSVNFNLWYSPSGTQTAVTNDQSAWFIDANIGGANVALGVANISTYTEITNSSLDLVLNPGSAAAKIPCSSTNASTGLTCAAGDESLGIVFTPPYPGYFDVCTNFTHETVGGGSVTGSTYFQIIQTQNSSQTIVQEGKARVGSRAYGDVATVNAHLPIYVCGSFLFSDTSEKTIRLMREQSWSGGGFQNIFADRNGSVGQRDIRVTVRPSTQNIARPVLTGDTVTSKGAVKPDLCSARAASDGTLSSPVGGCFASCNNSTTMACNFVANYWASAPNCWAISNSSSNLYTAGAGYASTTSVTFAKQDLGSVPFNHATTIFCHGQAQ